MSTPRKAPPGSKPTYDAIEKRCRDLQTEVTLLQGRVQHQSHKIGALEMRLFRAQDAVRTLSELLVQSDVKLTDKTVFDDEIPF